MLAVHCDGSGGAGLTVVHWQAVTWCYGTERREGTQSAALIPEPTMQGRRAITFSGTFTFQEPDSRQNKIVKPYKVFQSQSHVKKKSPIRSLVLNALSTAKVISYDKKKRHTVVVSLMLYFACLVVEIIQR